MKLKELSQEQRLRLKEIRNEYVSKFLTHRKIDRTNAEEAIRFVYCELLKKEMPKIFVVKSPMAAQKLANKLKGTERKYYPFGTWLTYGWASSYAYYDTFVEFGILPQEKFPKYHKLRKFVDSGIEFTIEFEKAIIITQPALYYKKSGRSLHCTDGPAALWEDGYAQFYINGRRMPKWIFEKHKKGELTKNDFIKEENEDVKAGIYEIVESSGEGSMLEFLGATETDRDLVTHGNGDIEELVLYKTKEKFKEETDLKGNSNVPLAWLRMICPSTGTRYLIPTDSSFDNCIEAAKYHRPSQVPTKLQYKWMSRN